LKSQFRKSEFVMELLQIALGVGHVALGSERALFQVLILPAARGAGERMADLDAG
jgi:hypothetical protein